MLLTRNVGKSDEIWAHTFNHSNFLVHITIFGLLIWLDYSLLPWDTLYFIISHIINFEAVGNKYHYMPWIDLIGGSSHHLGFRIEITWSCCFFFCGLSFFYLILKVGYFWDLLKEASIKCKHMFYSLTH